MKLCMSMIGLGMLACLQMASLVFSADLADCTKGCKEVGTEYHVTGDCNCTYYDGSVHCTTKEYEKVENPVANAYSCMVKSPQETVRFYSCNCSEHCNGVSSGSSYDREMATPDVEEDCSETTHSTDMKECLATST